MVVSIAKIVVSARRGRDIVSRVALTLTVNGSSALASVNFRENPRFRPSICRFGFQVRPKIIGSQAQWDGPIGKQIGMRVASTSKTHRRQMTAK